MTDNGRLPTFNLKSFDREKALVELWKNRDPEQKDRQIKVVTDTGEHLLLKLCDITDIAQMDSCYVRAEVHTKQESSQEYRDPRESFYDRLDEARKRKERRNMDVFLSALAKKGVKIDPNDPNFLDIANRVRGM